jgi:hypothetical protein
MTAPPSPSAAPATEHEPWTPVTPEDVAASGGQRIGYGPNDVLPNTAKEIADWMNRHHKEPKVRAAPASPRPEEPATDPADGECGACEKAVRNPTEGIVGCSRGIGVPCRREAPPAPSPSPGATPRCAGTGLDVDPCIHDAGHAGPHRYRAKGGFDYELGPFAPSPGATAPPAADLDALEALVAELPPGPWRPGRMDTESYDASEDGAPWKAVYRDDPDAPEHRGVRLPVTVARGYGNACRPVAAFLAAARNDLPALIAELRSLRRLRADEEGRDLVTCDVWRHGASSHLPHVRNPECINPVRAPSPSLPDAPRVLTGCQMRDTPETRELVAAAGQMLRAPLPDGRDATRRDDVLAKYLRAYGETRAALTIEGLCSLTTEEIARAVTDAAPRATDDNGAPPEFTISTAELSREEIVYAAAEGRLHVTPEGLGFVKPRAEVSR